ncbi:MAG: type II toxin-antitoxin system prevent-host-death family antitoxin [Mariprofundus sp.]
MTTMKASLFKATCLSLMDKINITGEEIIITKNGRPVSRLLPYRNKPATLFGLHAGSMQITGDLIEPLNESWDVDQ